MKTISIIGSGAVAKYVARQLARDANIEFAFAVIEPGMESVAVETFDPGVATIHAIDEAPVEPDLVLDCAGHGALRQHGEGILARGIDLVSVSSGALADEQLYRSLCNAAARGNAQLRIVSGAIGALDALSAAAIGKLDFVSYKGRKPPNGWKGSPAETKLDLDNMIEAQTHFSGTARRAALDYPKNANVAASVALAGVGFDKTTVELVADPGISENIHEVFATGEFGSLEFRIHGRSLPENPKSSAITAMSVVREVLNQVSTVVV